jgi:hypothetical protein
MYIQCLLNPIFHLGGFSGYNQINMKNRHSILNQQYSTRVYTAVCYLVGQPAPRNNAPEINAPPNNHGVMVSCSLVGAGVGLPDLVDCLPRTVL